MSYHKLQCTRVFTTIICLLAECGITVHATRDAAANRATAVSGTVTSGGSPLAGVTMTLSGGSLYAQRRRMRTAIMPSVIFRSALPLTPSLAGYAFAPPSRSRFSRRDRCRRVQFQHHQRRPHCYVNPHHPPEGRWYALDMGEQYERPTGQRNDDEQCRTRTTQRFDRRQSLGRGQ